MKRLLIVFIALGLIAGGVATAEAAPSTIGTKLTKLTASDGLTSDRFGISVAISGNTAVVGAPWEESQRGAAYVYRRVGQNWVEEAKLTASDGLATLKFGFAVAISGDTIIVGGSPYHAPLTEGSAYVFTRTDDSWIEEAKLTASDGANGNHFGISVAVSGDTAVVGASGANAAYLFTRTAEGWTETEKLLARDAAAGDNFGQFVAVSGDTALIGAPKGDGTTADEGSAYVFIESEGGWIQEAELYPSEGGAKDDEFGFWVGVSGDTAIVGVINDDVGLNIDQGSAYVFTRRGTTWTQEAHLIAPDGAPVDRFGRSVAISGDTLIVGAQNDDVAADDHPLTDQGSAYVFSRNGSTWTQQAKLAAADGGMGDLFGVSVAMSGRKAVIGAGFQNQHQGAAYIWDGAKNSTRTERTVQGEYGPFPAPVTGCNGVLDPFACLVVGTGMKEHFFTAKVTDLHGQPVFVQVKSGGSHTVAVFCGETDHPIRFPQGSTLEFMLAIPKWPGEMHLDCPASRVKTTGKISVTLSNKP